MFGVLEFPNDVLWCGLFFDWAGCSMRPLFPDSHVFQVLFVCLFNFPNSFTLSYSGTLTNCTFCFLYYSFNFPIFPLVHLRLFNLFSENFLNSVSHFNFSLELFQFAKSPCWSHVAPFYILSAGVYNILGFS